MTKLKKITFPAIVFMLIVVGCCKDKSLLNGGEPDFLIKSGTFIRLCIGYCQTEIEIADARVRYTINSWNDPEYPEKTITGSIAAQEWNELLESVDMEVFLSLDNVIVGYPYVADQGSEWIEIDHSGEIKRVTFDYNTTIEPIQEFVEHMREIRHQFHQMISP